MSELILYSYEHIPITYNVFQHLTLIKLHVAYFVGPGLLIRRSVTRNKTYRKIINDISSLFLTNTIPSI
jgi:hypothetical protein